MFRGEDASKQTTSDFLSEESERRIAEAQKRLDENERRESKEPTERDRVVEMVQGMYFKNIKRRELHEFFEDMADYIIKNGIIKK